jgi:hypothetical protein
MKAEDRASALVALVDADRASRARAILDPALGRAREEVAHARRAARSRVTTAIAEERAAFAARIAAAEARLATARRMVRQRRLKALLADGWERLPRALAARWDDADGRERWIDAAVRSAATILPATGWEVRGPASWSEGERARLTASLAARGIGATCEATPRIEAGIRVACRNVEIDATLGGLLDERAAVEGRLLHFFEEKEA